MSPKPRYDQLLAAVLDGIDDYIPTESPPMPKKTRPTRKQQDTQIRRVANATNSAFAQVAREIDRLQAIVAAVIDVQGLGPKVLEHLQADKQTATTPSKP